MSTSMFDSARSMGRFSRGSRAVAALGYFCGIVTYPFGIEYFFPCFFIGTTGILLWMFTGFRADHLEQLERERAEREARS